MAAFLGSSFALPYFLIVEVVCQLLRNHRISRLSSRVSCELGVFPRQRADGRAALEGIGCHVAINMAHPLRRRTARTQLERSLALTSCQRCKLRLSTPARRPAATISSLTRFRFCNASGLTATPVEPQIERTDLSAILALRSGGDQGEVPGIAHCPLTRGGIRWTCAAEGVVP